MARPTKYTQPRRQAILDGLRAGLTRTAAAARGEIDRDTLLDWMTRFPAFSDAVIRAEAEAEGRFTSTMAQAAAPHDVAERVTTVKADGSVETKETVRREFDWRAAESWLKRRRREDWGDNVAIDVDSEIKRLLAELAASREAETPG